MSKHFTIPLLSLFISACSTTAIGPSVLVLPGTGKDFGAFQRDDSHCRQFVQAQLAVSSRKPDSKDEGQQLYDIGYIQCMYGKGHKVPVPGDAQYDTRQDWHPPPPPNMPPPIPAEPAPSNAPGM